MTSGNRLKKLRKQAAQRQGGYCFYCRYPMWDSRPEEFIGRYGISSGLAQRFQCTAEHVEARCDGGKDVAPNIVAACRFCNTTRHKAKHAANAQTYMSFVRSRLAKGKWHPPQLKASFSK
ncbi:HNH endonuclease, partial [Hoeflea sp.]|uniref:HNH endonuclease n=1 Tax=Hoeflea sp. TaxID=1940281 RepID=UPI003A955B14